MGKTYTAGLVSAIAAAAGFSHHKNTASYADGPFNFPPFSNVPQPSPSSDADSPPPPPKVRNDHPRTTSAGFDPEALERGVKALKEISTSPHGKKVSTSSSYLLFNIMFVTSYFLFLQVFEVIKKQEETKSAELAAKVAEFKQMQAQHETVTSYS